MRAVSATVPAARLVRRPHLASPPARPRPVGAGPLAPAAARRLGRLLVLPPILLLLLPLLPAAVGHPVLWGVVPDLPGPGPGDEGVAVWSEAAWDLSGYRLVDRKGAAWTIPGGVRVAEGEAVWFTGHAAAWAQYGMPALAAVWDEPRFVLANSADEVCLHDPAGAVLDCMAWGPGGDVTFRSPGAVYLRGDGSWVTPRIHRVGESAIAPAAFEVSAVTFYASPDSSHAVLLTLVASARERLHLHVYDLRHFGLVDALVAAMRAHPAIDVQVLVDGRVVGQTQAARDEVAWHLWRLREAGAELFQAQGGRYTHHHLKVLVADDAVAVQSENWVESGVPPDTTRGNRGWGAVVEDAVMADWFAAWMAADRTAWDIAPWQGEPPAAERLPVRLPPLQGAYGPAVAPVRIEGRFLVTPVVSPDHTAYTRDDPVLALLEGARDRVWGQQMRMATNESNRLGWETPDRYLGALVQAAARGVEVRVLLAGPFGDDDPNAAPQAWLREHGIPVQRIERDGILILHNKGWIVDDAVVVGSMNGNHASRSANREVLLIVEGPGVAQAAAALFLADWDPGPSWPPVAAWPILLAAAAVAAALRSRR